MTRSSPIVQKAVDLLSTRYLELKDELEEVGNALSALGYVNDDGVIRRRDELPDVLTSITLDRTPLTAQAFATRPGVRTAVQGLLESEPRTLHLDAVVSRLRPLYEDRAPDKFRANVRSALHQLKGSGAAVAAGRGLYRAAKWPTDAASPTETVGLADGLEQMPEGGEHTDGQGSHHDHRDDLAGRNDDRDHLGAPVGH